jgi:hypothetical protein
MPPEHALMRTTLRVLSMEEIVRDVGVGFDVILDTVNSFEPAILERETGSADPILYFYEDFLQVFDPIARERYGVYYTPVKVVTYMVAALDRALQDNLGTAGLTDEAVTMLDPATGTGTFLLGVFEHVRRSVESSTGPGAVPGALRALSTRLFGFELLVGPYAVADLAALAQKRTDWASQVFELFQMQSVVPKRIRCLHGCRNVVIAAMAFGWRGNNCCGIIRARNNWNSNSSFGWRRFLHRQDLKQPVFGFSLQLHGHRLSGVDGPCVAGMTLCLLARDAGYKFAGNQSRDIIAHRRRFYPPSASQRQRSKRHVERLRSSIVRGRCERGSKARRYGNARASFIFDGPTRRLRKRYIR